MLRRAAGAAAGSALASIALPVRALGASPSCENFPCLPTDTCCDGHDCCAATEFCCGGSCFKKGGDIGCCHNQTYNMKEEHCCPRGKAG
jgi:hypothetical protein